GWDAAGKSADIALAVAMGTETTDQQQIDQKAVNDVQHADNQQSWNTWLNTVAQLSETWTNQVDAAAVSWSQTTSAADQALLTANATATAQLAGAVATADAGLAAAQANDLAQEAVDVATADNAQAHAGAAAD